MKIQAIRLFTDRISRKEIQRGAILEVSTERGQELIGKGVAIAVKEEQVARKTKEEKVVKKTK